MNTIYFENWSKFSKKIQEPLQSMAYLNVEILQDLSLLKTEDLFRLSKPEELLEKQVEIAVKNGHKTLDYIQKSFDIFEKALKDFVKDAKNLH